MARGETPFYPGDPGAGSGPPTQRIASIWRHFADVHAAGRSPLYVEVARAVADDGELLELLAAMPAEKWQPNLLLAAVRYLHPGLADADAFLELARADREAVAEVIATHTTQTNEPARCATLLPALARLAQPLALLEVGASAGLCLLPDRYGYDYGAGRRLEPRIRGRLPAPTFACRANDATPIPTANVEVAWRAGLDLNPVELTDGDQVRWLEALVWPGEEYRIPPLRAAIALALEDPPPVHRGDLRSDLRALAQTAPSDATLVVFHTAVLAYVRDPGDRRAFRDTVAELGAVWIANEGAEKIPGIDPAALAAPADAFLLCVDGTPTAWTDGHATWIDWIS